MPYLTAMIFQRIVYAKCMFIISYDFEDNRTRARFAKFLEKYGKRIQYSVFEIRHSRRVLDLIRYEIEKKYSPHFSPGDSVLIFPLCQLCQAKIGRFGSAAHEDEDIIFL